MVLKHWLIIFILLLPLTAAAQVDEAVEQWLEETDDEQAAGDMNDLLLQLSAQPVNVNDTAALAALPLISPFQLQALRNYIILHGQLLSLKELRFIPGFDSSTVALLEPYLTVAPCQPRKRWHPADGRHSLVAGIGGTAEQTEGYRNGRYPGDNLHALLCYRYQLYNNIDLRLTVDKDPTEEWGKNNYYGYHLIVNDIGPLERLILGRYNLQFGQGLTLWTGLRPFNLTGATPLRFGAGVRQAAAFYEEDYQEGIAARIRLGHGFHLSAFGSRTDGEVLAGGHLDYRHGNLILGLTAAYTLLDDSLETRDYLYNQNRFIGRWQMNTGIDALYQWHRTTLYGEVALGENLAPAFIGGLQVKADSRNRFGISYRYYHPQYHNLHAQGYTIGNTQGEQGVTLDAESRLPLGITLLGSVDLHSFATLRYADYTPSTGDWLRLQISKTLGRYISGMLRYTYRMKERNIPNVDSTLYLSEQTVKQQLQGEVKASWHRWTLGARAISSLFESENGIMQRGWLANITARYDYRHLQATAAVACFDVGGYYARIYLSESNIQYAWSMPALYGRGLRTHILLRYRLNHHWAMAAKYTLTYMPEQENIGSGDNRTEGPVRQTWFVQLRCSF